MLTLLLKIKHLTILFAALQLLGATACQAQTEEPRVESFAFNLLLKKMLTGNVACTSVDTAYKMYKQMGKSPLASYAFVDAREIEEYNTSHINHAIWVGYNDFDIARLKAAPVDTSTVLIVYCSIGARSEAITQRLQQMGYSKATNLYGGIFEWKNQGYPVYKNKQPTNKVHAYSKTWGIWLNNAEKVY